MLSIITKSAIVVAMASAVGSMVDAGVTPATVSSDLDLSNSCRDAANKYRASAGATLFPPLTASAVADMTLKDTEIEAKFCVEKDAKAIAKSSIDDKLVLFKGTGTVALADCAAAVTKWHTDGMLAIKAANPPNYTATSPPPFYNTPNNVAFAGVTFGKENITLGTAALRCVSVVCKDGGMPVIVCDVVAANAEGFIAATKPVWSKAEYDALVAIAPPPTTSGAEVPVASILGLSATALGLMASL